MRDNQEIAELLQQATVSAHPRLLIKDPELPALLQCIEADALLQRVYHHVLDFSTALIDAPLLEREQIGRRLLHVSRHCLKRMLYLSMAWRLSRERRFAERAEAEMRAVAAFSDWNPSHFLDVAEMTAALAIGYDWCFDALSEQGRAQIKTAIIELGLKQSLIEGQDHWLSRTNNWNQVCNAGMVVGALAVLEDELELAEQICQRAVASVPLAMAGYAPDGNYPEGPGYWGYGTNYNILLLAALESVLGTDAGLIEQPGFMESSDYYQQVTGPLGLYFNYSDAGKKDGASFAMQWFAERRNKPSLLWRQRSNIEAVLEKEIDIHYDQQRFFPLMLLWSAGLSRIERPQLLHWHGNGHTPVGLHRSDWQHERTFFTGLKGGSPGAPHAHMDVGSFVLDALGERWVHDLGAEDYHRIEQLGINLWDGSQKGERWDLLRLNNFSHNTLVVDNQKQRVDGFAPIMQFSDQQPMPHTVIDMSTVYQDQLKQALRGLAMFEQDTLIIQDEIQTLERETRVRWAIATAADVRIIDEHHVVLTQNGQHMYMTLHAPADCSLEIFDISQPPEPNAPNPGYCMPGFYCTAAADTAVQLTVSISTVEAKDVIDKKLADWS